MEIRLSWLDLGRRARSASDIVESFLEEVSFATEETLIAGATASPALERLDVAIYTAILQAVSASKYKKARDLAGHLKVAPYGRGRVALQVVDRFYRHESSKLVNAAAQEIQTLSRTVGAMKDMDGFLSAFTRHKITLANAGQPMPASMRENLLETAAVKVNQLSSAISSWRTHWSLTPPHTTDPEAKADHLFNLLEAEVCTWRDKDAEKKIALGAMSSTPCGNCGKTGHTAKACWAPGGGAYNKRKGNPKGGGKSSDGKGKAKGPTSQHLLCLRQTQV